MKACAILAIVLMTTRIVVMIVVRIERRILRTSPLGISRKLAVRNSHLACNLACLRIEKMSIWHIGWTSSS
jgi:hypothetical protein